MQAVAFDSTSGNFAAFALLSLLKLEVDPSHLAVFKTDETDSSKRCGCNIISRIGCVIFIFLRISTNTTVRTRTINLIQGFLFAFKKTMLLNL